MQDKLFKHFYLIIDPDDGETLGQLSFVIRGASVKVGTAYAKALLHGIVDLRPVVISENILQ